MEGSVGKAVDRKDVQAGTPQKVLQFRKHFRSRKLAGRIGGKA
jgi:hypothetical protein